jgi:hypothetical protein
MIYDTPNDLTNPKTRKLLGITSSLEKLKDKYGNSYLIVSNQKILIMDAEILQNEYTGKKQVRVRFQNYDKEVTIRFIRISECPNDDLEYGRPTVSVLVEWKTKIPTYPGNLSGVNGLRSQVNNYFIINPESNNKPNPPIARQSRVTKVYASDFRKFDPEDAAHYGGGSSVKGSYADMPIVAVMDTGLKFKWENNGVIERTLLAGRKKFQFKIAKAKSDCIQEENFGYCGITEYLTGAAGNPLLAKLTVLDKRAILNSPYDDNKVDEIQDNGMGTGDGQGIEKLEVGRHGTIISAILNEHGCRVLPVKVFNGGGMGTLFDILCGCNYILSCKRQGTDIKVLNASFGSPLNEEGRNLLFRKTKALNDRGIWVVAAAGNEDIELDQPGNARYPAQFGLATSTGDSTGGLEKVITVNSAYKETDRAGNFGLPVAIKVRSSRSGGFASALPMDNDAPLAGTSFAAPYAAAVLAGGADSLANKADAVAYLKAHPVGDVVSFENP